jgi:hypothetical protein
MALEEASSYKKQPIVMSSPFSDEELVKGEAPRLSSTPPPSGPEVAVVQPQVMSERDDPAVTRNGGGQHISKDDEDNGWVVPLDELSKDEREQEIVANTKF